MNDKYIAVKVWVVVLIQTFLIAFNFISGYLEPWDNLTKVSKIITNIFHFSAAFTILIILSVAFFNLRKSGGDKYSLSKKNLIV